MTAPTAQGVSARMGPEVARSTIAGSAKNLFMAVFVAAAGSAALAAIAAQSLDASPVALVLGVTLAAVAMAAIAYLVAPFHEQTVTLFERGVTMKVRGRTRAVALPGLDRVEFRTYPLYANGVYRGTVRRLRLHSASGTVSIRHQQIGSATDSLLVIIERILQRVVDDAERTIQNGGSVCGERWRLDGQGLWVGGAGAPIPLRDIARCGVWEGKLALWRRNEQVPFFAIAEESNHAFTLGRLLERLPKADLSAAPASAAEPKQLGRVLFRKDASAGAGVALILIASFILMISIGLWAGGFGFEPVSFAVGGGLLALAVLALRRKLTCYENGIGLGRFFGGQEVIAFHELESLTWNAVRHYSRGAYTGTTVDMTLRSENRKKLRCKFSVAGSDADINAVRDHAAAIIASRLQRRLDQGEVSWGPVQISRNAIRYHDRSRIGTSAPATASLQAGLRYSITDGALHLFVPGQDKPVARVASDVENFFPGLVLFDRLVSSGTGRR